MTNEVASIQIGVNLIDDYLYVEEAPVQEALSRRFAIVHNPTSNSPTSELVSIGGNGELVHFCPDESSNSGWSTTAVPCSPPNYGRRDSDTSSDIQALAAFYDAAGGLNVLVYYQTTQANAYCATWMQRSTTGAWTEATLGGTAEDALGFVYQSDVYLDGDNTPYVYGVSGGLSTGAFFIASFDSGTNSWDVGDYYWLLSTFSPALSTQAAFRMAEGSGGNQFTVLWVDTPPGEVDTSIYHQGASLGRKQIQWDSNGPGSFNPNLGTLTVEGLFGLPGDFGQDNVLILDGTGALHLVQGYTGSSPTATTLTGAGATQPAGTVGISVGVDSTGVLTVFAIESGQGSNLWYVQQQSPNEPLDPTSWVNLGGKLFAVGCRSSMAAGPEVFCAEIGAQGPTVYHMDRSLSNPVWSTRKVAAPVAMSGDPTNIASYTMELTAQDSYGNAVANAWLSVVTDQAATLIWNLVAYHVGPNTPTPIQVDCSGQASVLLQCDSLKPPVVTFTCTNNGSTVSRWCQGDVVEVKTEETALPPLSDSVAPTLQTVDGQTLLDKQLFSTSGYNSQSDALTAANNTATAINSAGQWMTNNRNDPSGSGLLDTSAITTPHWQIDFVHPDGPRFRELTLEEARAIIRRSRDGSAPALLGGALGSVFGDVAHFFKKEWENLHKLTASLENDVLTITLDAVEGTQSFVIQTVKEAGAALETVFAKIKQIAEDIYNVIAEVIAWLKTLFDWQDILNTQKAFKACINTTLTNIQTTVKNNDATEAVNKWIGTFKSEVDGYFQGAENVFAAGTSYNAYANAAAGGSPSPLLADASNGNFLAATPTNNAHQQHASKCNYVMSRSKNHFNTSSPISGVSLAALGGSDPCQSITEAIANNLSGSTFTSGFADINTLLQTLGSNPGAIFDLIILDFIKAAQSLTDFTIDSIEAVIDAVIQVATDLTTDAFNVIDTILNTEIDIPVISWLWTNVIDPKQPFTFLDVLSLIFAVLATILYKVLDIDDGNAPFPEDVSQDIANNLPWPNIPGSASEAAPLTATTDPASWQTPLAITAGIAMFCNGVTAMYIDTAAYENAVADNPDAALPNPFFYSLIGCCFRTLVFGGAAPYKAFSSSPMTAANALTIAYWGSNGFRLLVDFIYSVVGTAKGNVECLPTYGPIGKCAAGCVSLALAIAASVEHHKEGTWTGMDMANVIIRPISAVSKPLLLTKDDEVLGFLLILELAVGLGAMITQIERVQEG